MSVLNKTPFVKKVLETTDCATTMDLKAWLDGTTTPVFRSMINDAHRITVDDKYKKGNGLVLETKDKVYTGYWFFNDDYCVLFAYEEKSQEMTILDIDYENNTFEIIDEEMSIGDFRREVENLYEVVGVVRNGTGELEVHLREVDGSISGFVLTVVSDIRVRVKKSESEYIYLTYKAHQSVKSVQNEVMSRIANLAETFSLTLPYENVVGHINDNLTYLYRAAYTLGGATYGALFAQGFMFTGDYYYNYQYQSSQMGGERFTILQQGDYTAFGLVQTNNISYLSATLEDFVDGDCEISFDVFNA